MRPASPAYSAYLFLLQQWPFFTSCFEVPDSANLSSWSLPSCFYADKCGIGKALEEFKENPSYVPHIATIVGVETVCFGVRLASKVYRFTSWGPDDFLIAAAYVLSVATLPLTVIICLTLSFILNQFLMCNRASCLWDNSMQPLQGCRCHDAWEGTGGFPAMNAALDVWLIILPVRQVVRTGWHWKQKCHAAAMFGLGFLTAITAVMRVVSVLLRDDSAGLDPLDLQLWYALESATAFVVVCMPSIRLMVATIWYRHYKRTVSHSL
ncbi:hypothetical protein CH35J_000492 [Colletotrichum higginsianum]|uniref:Rhodopsin domain-containing protein n=1 Tax=Colletotrichum higginsianum TaxID=80884 RepID=A0A4T0WK66_9PEZI|nr:hypothetical protein CH35J_000492 [Colletotrichum higginsianum]